MERFTDTQEILNDIELLARIVGRLFRFLILEITPLTILYIRAVMSNHSSGFTAALNPSMSGSNGEQRTIGLPVQNTRRGFRCKLR